ncbi:extracellular calcium-sensing receptor-like [Erpetoichthys calabaricus]|uniref:extracellular calcium-sensing receptor-like n=1 Tax=Erpetoichthys calabaricus TaxID=27687 RepID=UPI002234C52D|nr:extracellular calcium-sensing receptor-like [Erpetoichthys calabaricus]
MLGGIFAVHLGAIPPDLSFTSKPEQWKCEGFDLSVFQRLQTMVFAIEEINKDDILLPNITLGYRLYDNCMNLQVAMRAASTLIGGVDDITDYHCEGLPSVIAIVGDPLSSHSIAISRTVSAFGLPLVSYCATCSCLSNKMEFPTFFRTVPSDAFQVKVIVEIIKHYGWTWVGVVATDDDYGLNAVWNLNEEISKFGCISYTETLEIDEKARIPPIVRTIKHSSAKVVIAFLPVDDMAALVKAVVYENLTDLQWIASESWSISSLASKENFNSFGGTIGIATKRGQIPGLEDFLLEIKTDYNSNNNLYNLFWETMFECKFYQNSPYLPNVKPCTGLEDIKGKRSEYTDVSQLRIAYNVYQAVYALAHALNDLLFCQNKTRFEDKCMNIRDIQPHQVRKIH